MKNKELIQKIQTLVQQERRIGVEILELLYEIEQCKAYSDLGYDGLFSFCVKELRYSEAQAYRRIQAMRALKQIPELKEQIESGKMTVTTVSQVQTYLNEEKKKGVKLEREEIAATFEKFADQSAKEVETQILELKGEASNPKLVIEMTPELRQAWAQIKNLSAHQTRGQEEKMLLMLMEEWLGRHDPERKLRQKETRGKKTIAQEARTQKGMKAAVSQEEIEKEFAEQPSINPEQHVIADSGRTSSFLTKVSAPPDLAHPHPAPSPASAAPSGPATRANAKSAAPDTRFSSTTSSRSPRVATRALKTSGCSAGVVTSLQASTILGQKK